MTQKDTNMEKEILKKRIYDLWREGKISGRVYNVLQSLKIEDVESLVVDVIEGQLLVNTDDRLINGVDDGLDILL